MADEITRSDDEEIIEAPAPQKKKILKGNLPPPPPVKKERTPAQIAAFERARASREANIKKRDADAKRLAEYDALMLKQKLVEKANKLKLKTMKKVEVIDSISSDEDEVIIEKPKKSAPKQGVHPLPPEGRREHPYSAPPPPPKPKQQFKFV